MEKKDKKITSLSEIAKVREIYDGKTVELPPFEDGTKFVAKLRRLSLLGLCKSGKIPNPLLGAALEIYEGRQKADIKQYAEILDIICELVMVEPKYEDIKDILSDQQKYEISLYAQSGVSGLEFFRKILKLQEDGASSKKQQ